MSNKRTDRRKAGQVEGLDGRWPDRQADGAAQPRRPVLPVAGSFLPTLHRPVRLSSSMTLRRTKG